VKDEERPFLVAIHDSDCDCSVPRRISGEEIEPINEERLPIQSEGS